MKINLQLTQKTAILLNDRIAQVKYICLSITIPKRIKIIKIQTYNTDQDVQLEGLKRSSDKKNSFTTLFTILLTILCLQ